MGHRIFLLSPANCSGERARLIMSGRGNRALAQRLREPHGAPMGDVFSFMSGLYFRGKLAYARAFAAPPAPRCPLTGRGALVITPGAGLCPAETPVTVAILEAFARIDIDPGNPRYRRPLLASAREVAGRITPDCDVVLLGSIASGKYADVLLEVFGARLKFPVSFVGRGDMSRGGLMLRCVATGQELDYVPVAGAVRHGPRPPRLTPSRRLAPGAAAPPPH
jgi:hypothetical protein